jgi:hypothetical protein
VFDLIPSREFLRSESGAITVDWTVLSAACVSLCLGTAGVMTDIFDMLSGQVDGEMRDRQMGTEWVEFAASHFENALQTGYISEEQAEGIYDLAEGMSSSAVRAHLAEGITALENGTITTDELMELIAVASVADQLNLADQAMLDHYFGFDGSDPYYMSTAAAPTANGETYAASNGACNQGNGNGAGQGCDNGNG